MSTPLRVIDQEGFDAIECNRCGACCEAFLMGTDIGERGFWQHSGPLGWLELYAYWSAQDRPSDHFAPMDAMLFYGQLEPTLGADGVYRYKCGHFERDAEGLGNCTVYDQRPTMCSKYPYGEPVHEFADCSWNVELIEYEPVQGIWS